MKSATRSSFLGALTGGATLAALAPLTIGRKAAIGITGTIGPCPPYCNPPL